MTHHIFQKKIIKATSLLYLFLGLMLTLPIISCHQKSNEYTTLQKFDQQLEECGNHFDTLQKKCPEGWNLKCHYSLRHAHQEFQTCLIKQASQVLSEFYDLPPDEALMTIKKYRDFMANHFLELWTENKQCLQENCGLAIYLYADIHTSRALESYVRGMMDFLLTQYK